MKKRAKRILFIAMLLCVMISNWLIMSSSIGQSALKQYGDGTGMLDMKPRYTQKEATDTLLALGREGADIYTNLLLIDFVFIIGIAYVLSAIVEVTVSLPGLPDKLRRLKWIAYVRSGLDAMENILILTALSILPAGKALLGVAGVMTFLKFIMAGIYVIVLMILLLVGLIRFRQRKKEEKGGHLA